MGFFNFMPQMEEGNPSERGLPQIASIMSRVRDLKSKYRNEDNITDELNCTKISADTTGMCVLLLLSLMQQILES